MILLIGTLENVRLQAGDRVVVSLGYREYEAEIVSADDPAKLKVKLLNTGSEVWVGRRAVLDVVTD